MCLRFLFSFAFLRQQAERRVLLVLGQGEEGLCLFQGDPELPPHMVEKPQSPQHLGKLRRFPHLLAQLPRPVIGLFNLRSRPALDGAQC